MQFSHAHPRPPTLTHSHPLFSKRANHSELGLSGKVENRRAVSSLGGAYE